MNRMHQIALAATIVVVGMTVASAATMDFTDNFNGHAVAAGSNASGWGNSGTGYTAGTDYTVMFGYAYPNKSASANNIANRNWTDPHGTVVIGNSSNSTVNNIGPGGGLAGTNTTLVQAFFARTGDRGAGTYEAQIANYRTRIVLGYQDANNYFYIQGGAPGSYSKVAGDYSTIPGVVGGSNTFSTILFSVEGGTRKAVCGINTSFSSFTGNAISQNDTDYITVKWEPASKTFTLTELATDSGDTTPTNNTTTASNSFAVSDLAVTRTAGLFGVGTSNTSSVETLTYMAYTSIPEPATASLLAGVCSLGLLARQRRK